MMHAGASVVWDDTEDMDDMDSGFPIDDYESQDQYFYNAVSAESSSSSGELSGFPSALEYAADSLLSPFFSFGAPVKDEFLNGTGFGFTPSPFGYVEEHHQFSFQPPPPPFAEDTTARGLDLIIDGQPAAEVRTRTPSELRTFSVSARVVGPFRQLGTAHCRVALLYAPSGSAPSEKVPKEILGGTKQVPVLSDGTVMFDNLAISESSTKHKEREFVLRLSVIGVDGEVLARRETRPFYAYSHKKVLQRRGSVKLRALSRSCGRVSGGDSMHVIGLPFIQGPALSIVFHTPYGDVAVRPTEFFSESVLFFDLPPLPIPASIIHSIPPETEIKVQVYVSNDGRSHSNSVDFTYIMDSPAEMMRRARI
eukprot:TRINITY_DN236_c0_g1_i1.p2 TRINITY_DN236_c0_g1~~TRINITY_DN236_c0_g1_i1.p2  ORF type:complete len:366 (+),score=122.87 TRINITY_DN236_c0_g1_i1:190-1287(+)